MMSRCKINCLRRITVVPVILFRMEISFFIRVVKANGSDCFACPQQG